MFTIATYDYECTKKCKIHGGAITSALTKRSVSSEALARYIAKLCRNFIDICDDEGRSALAMAVSVGNRCDLVNWLLAQGANVNLKDKESGHTPLVRAICYGNIAEAVLLQMRGAHLTPDNDFVNPLQYCCRVKKPIENENRCETFVWGKNKNYNLGIGNVQAKDVPDYLETFRKDRIWIDQVSMSSYHSLFLSDTGEVYATGHGKGGRLGTGDELIMVTPRKVTIPVRDDSERIVCVSAGRNHSMVLSNKNRVYVTGSNVHSQLGMKNVSEFLNFHEIPMNFSDAKKVVATDYCSYVVTYTDIYAFGANLGQLGFKKEVERCMTPRKIPFNHDNQPIEVAECSNSALVCYTEFAGSHNTSLLHILYKYETKILKKPLMERIKAINVSGGYITDNSKGITRSDKPLRFIVLTELQNFFIWKESIEKFVRCSIETNRFLEVDSVIWCNEDLLISFFGNLYRGTMTEVKFKAAQDGEGNFRETYTKKELSVSERAIIKLKRIPFTDKVVDFCTDPEGENYVCLLENPRKYFSLPDLIEKPYNYANLYAELSEFDSIHDVVFEICGQTFPAHRIIIFARCEYLRAVVQAETTKKVQLKELQAMGLTAPLFELILRFLYTNDPIMKFEIERLTADYHQTLTMLKKVLTYMGLSELITSLKKNSEKCGKPFEPIQRSEYTELFDVTIKLDGSREIRAHKCILMARLEYFNMMFMHSWAESNCVTLNGISVDYMLPVIEFLYSNNVEEIRNSTYTDNYLYKMITICDQFFVLELKLIFELIASEKLSVRNCGEILEFAHTYNCETLQNCCMQFISLNLARILEHRSLEDIDLDALQPINKFYRQFFGLEAYRTITPYSSAVSDDELLEFIKDFSVDLNVQNEPEDAQRKQIKVKSKPSRSSLDKRNYEKEGIMSIKDLSVEDEGPKIDTKRHELVRETSEIMEKLENEAKATWLKVNDKKDVLKKKSVLAGLKANEVLKNETKTSFDFVPLKPPTPSLLTSPSTSKVSSPSPEPERKVTTFSLADITPMKRSQKTRKRTTSSTWSQLSTSPGTSTTAIATSPPLTNAWNTIPVVETTSPFDLSSPLTNNNVTNTTKKRNSRGASCDIAQSQPSTSSFSSIIESEIKNKQYNEKIKTKSLVLTQMEEKAIEELHEFYNVAETFDETITIERKRYGDGVQFTGNWYN